MMIDPEDLSIEVQGLDDGQFIEHGSIRFELEGGCMVKHDFGAVGVSSRINRKQDSYLDSSVTYLNTPCGVLIVKIMGANSGHCLCIKDEWDAI